MKLFKKEKFPNSEYLSRNGFYIPSGLNLSKKKMEYVTNCLNKIVE